MSLGKSEVVLKRSGKIFLNVAGGDVVTPQPTKLLMQLALKNSIQDTCIYTPDLTSQEELCEVTQFPTGRLPGDNRTENIPFRTPP